jgi:hypothetical protein
MVGRVWWNHSHPDSKEGDREMEGGKFREREGGRDEGREGREREREREKPVFPCFLFFIFYFIWPQPTG